MVAWKGCIEAHTSPQTPTTGEAMTDSTAQQYTDIDTRVFPRASRRGHSCGQLKLQEIKATELVAQYGSPLYVIDEGEARSRARETREAFERAFSAYGASARVYYASKAFLCIEVAQWMSDEGLGVDVATGGELGVALAAGIDPQRIGVHGNNKSVREIERAVAAGVGSIVIDSEQEIERIATAATAAGVTQRVFLRVNSGVHASTHDYLATSHEDQKFGVPLSQAEELVALIRSHASLEFRGLHCHIGSQIFATDGFRESAERLLGLYATLRQTGEVPDLNLGGGFGIAYTSLEADEVPHIETFATLIAEAVHDTCETLGLEIPNVAFEPGRSIIGPAGVTLYTVGTTKAVELTGNDPEDGGSASRLYVSVDGGMSDNARPALYDSVYVARLASRRSETDPILTRIVGKHCESGDIIIDREWLPGDIQPGDLLAVPATGAYCWSLSSNYNYVPRPPVVAVREGTSRLIVRGQSEDDLIAQSVVPHERITETES